ncbi:hypothetical protein ACO0LV_13855 [Pseudactinotalea sp. Z1739]|uniref:hypothetical protein n=1 Tax=Pseudactinotalea sp. Z1739 TaxID=3413028 RepID=UPI003C79EBBF
MSTDPAPRPADDGPGESGTGERLPMVEVIEDLLANLEAAPLLLDSDDVAQARELRARLVAQVRNHLIPRLREVAAPVLVVIGGSTGAGKSTLLNSVLGEEVSPAGVLRPTTRQPVLATHPADAHYLEGHPVLDLADVVTHEQVPRGLGLLDAPDLDSVRAANRNLALELIELADLWVFVTTGSRYGDAVPWSRLREASERGLSLAVVLNRIEPDALIEVRRDLFQRLQAQGFGALPLFVVPDVGPHQGLLEPKLVGELVAWLKILGAQSQSRAVIARTVRGAWPSLRRDVQEVAAAVEIQRRTSRSLRGQVVAAVRPTAEQIHADLGSGAAAIGAPSTAWLSSAGSGGVLAPLVDEPAGPRQRWRAKRSTAARVESVRSLRDTAVGAAGSMVREAGTAAELSVRQMLAESAAGRQIAELVDVDEAARDREQRVETLISEWGTEAERRGGELGLSAEQVGLDDQGAASLVEVAAVGVDGAERAVGRLFGTRGETMVAEMRKMLAEWAGAAVGAETTPYLDALDELSIDDAPARSLRLRASELRGYV